MTALSNIFNRMWYLKSLSTTFHSNRLANVNLERNEGRCDALGLEGQAGEHTCHMHEADSRLPEMRPDPATTHGRKATGVLALRNLQKAQSYVLEVILRRLYQVLKKRTATLAENATHSANKSYTRVDRPAK